MRPLPAALQLLLALFLFIVIALIALPG